MTQKNFRVKNGLAVGNVIIDATSDSIANVVDITANGNIDFSTATSVDLGTSNAIHITDGFPGQVLQSAGNGNVGWLGFTPQVGMTSVVDYFTGNGNTATYTLTTTPVNNAFTTVVIDGITQLKESYSISDNTITLGGTLPQDSRLEVTTLNGSNTVVPPYNSAIAAGNSSIEIITNGNINFSTTAKTNLGAVANVSITGGSNLQFLQTNGNGVLSWATVSQGNASNANYANYAGEANVANTAYSVAAANITGTISFATNSTTANVANSVAAANITGTVANSNYSAYSGQANLANSATTAATANNALAVSGANVSGAVANASYATYAGTANAVSAANVSGTVANAGYATYAGTANSVAAANVTGTVANATYATTAGTANAVAGANVTGTVANATYATTAGTAATVTTNAQPNITSVGTLTALTSNGNVNFTGSNVSLGNVANLRITGSSANQFLRANGSNSFTFEDFKMYSELHIDPVNGDDANEGSYQYPVKTMAQANSMLNGTISIVYLHQGTYTDNVTITANNLDIVGVSDAGGGIIDYTGNFTLNQTTSSVRVQGISFANLTVATTNAVTYLDSVSVSGTFTKSGNQYVQIRSSRMQGTAVNITGGGQTTFTSPLLTNLTVNNSSATTTIQSAVNLTTVNVAAGTLLLRDSIVFSNANANSAITSSAGSVTYVYNTNIVSPAGTVGRVSLAGYWSINQSQYDYANSTSNALLNLQTVSYSDLISVGTLAAVSLSGNLTGTVTGNVAGAKFSNGNSNVTMTANGNITMYVAGNSTARLTATSTGANIAGTANITGNTAIGGNLTTVGTVTSSGNVNGTGFLVGNGAVSNVALGYMPTAGTAAEMAIRDYSTVPTTMYFDAGMGSNNAGSQFRFRGSNTYTEYATVNQYGIALPTRSAFRVYGSGTTNNLTTTQNGNGVLNSNNWTVDYSQGTGFSSSTGVFTAPVAGLYSTTLIARVSNTSSAQIAVVKNYASTNAVQAMWECGANCSTNHFGVSSIAKLAAGDTLVIRVLLGQITFDGNDSWAVAYIG